MLILRLDAPFGTFRTLTAGSFRPTAPFITPSAAYGLILNIAGIDMRYNDEKSVATLICTTGLPSVEIALGARGSLPRQQTIFQQLHNYPVGASGKEYKAMTRGNKYNISPVRRAFLSDIRAYIALRTQDKNLEKDICDGLAGTPRKPRTYGLPFVGDNSFLPDRLEVVDDHDPAYWYELVEKGGGKEQIGITRLTISIDRLRMENTRSALFAPQQEASKEIPKRAWVSVTY